ncbi:MAG: ABC transporter ATP-binding protein [Promethearchaeota archaeon]
MSLDLTSITPAIALEGVFKRYKLFSSEILALDNVSLTINEGELVVIQGPSGAGKTTLLYVMAGLTAIDDGIIRIYANTISTMPQEELALFRSTYIGFMFQTYYLISTLTAFENIRLSRDLANPQDYEKTKEKAEELLALLQLTDRKDHLPRHLSGGEQQRVAFARALINSPEILICDEPTANLDPSSTALIQGILQQKKGDLTILIVTHDPQLVSLADRTFSLDAGQLTEL